MSQHLIRQNFLSRDITIKKLSGRQTKIMELMCVGATTKEIARILGGAPSTIETHIKIIFDKFGAKNRIHAAFLFAMYLATTQEPFNLQEAERLLASIQHQVIF